LTSDLLTVHDGQYIVRVCVGAEGGTLACGLGTSTALEQAEDIATQRALERLGWGNSGGEAATPANPIAPVVPLPVAAPSSPPAPDAARPELDIADNPVLPLSPVALAVPSPPVDESFGPDPVANPVGDLEDDLGSLGAEPAMAVDLSDIIAQTDVELQRLGWSVSQGREFLEKTYGKRSRHDLTDEELLEFLLYLETQTPPGS
jgi:hypothetical protein